MNAWKYCVLVFLSIILLTGCTDSESEKTDNEEKDDTIYVCTFSKDLTGIDLAVTDSYLEKGYCCGTVVEYDKCGSGYAMRFTKE